MFLAIAALLIQPALSAKAAFPANTLALIQPSESVVASSELSGSDSKFTQPDGAIASVDLPADLVPSSEIKAAEPALPASPAPIVISKPGKNYTISMSSLLAESRRRQRIWLGLGIASHSAAAFDAWSTRRAITSQGAQELNPIFKPFAGNASIYAAVQAWPVAMDYLAKKMMYSRYSWARHMWWVPQSASAAGSILCGAHNVGVHRIGN